MSREKLRESLVLLRRKVHDLQTFTRNNLGCYDLGQEDYEVNKDPNFIEGRMFAYDQILEYIKRELEKTHSERYELVEEYDQIYIVDNEYPGAGYIMQAAFEQSDWSYDMIKEQMERVVKGLNTGEYNV